jgi:hypothetical protein
MCVSERNALAETRITDAWTQARQGLSAFMYATARTLLRWRAIRKIVQLFAKAIEQNIGVRADWVRLTTTMNFLDQMNRGRK